MKAVEVAGAILDTRMLLWLVTMVFLAGGAWHSLGSLADRVTKLEVTQGATGIDIRTIMSNQAAMCQALGVECSR